MQLTVARWFLDEISGQIMHSKFDKNSGTHSTEALGGAVYAINSDTAAQTKILLGSCVLTRNSAHRGGALYSDTITEIKVVNSLIVANVAVIEGGGLWLGGTSYVTKGDDLWLGGTSYVTSCTISDNQPPASGVFLNTDNTDTITNSIVWHNKINGKAPTIEYSRIDPEVDGTCNGSNNVCDNPFFIDPSVADADLESGNYDFGLQKGSPCADSGNNAELSLTLSRETRCLTVDLNNKFRVADDGFVDDRDNATFECTTLDAVVDMGAYESFSEPAPENVVYVNASASGEKTGTSWTNAFASLQRALKIANDPFGRVSEIWVGGRNLPP